MSRLFSREIFFIKQFLFTPKTYEIRKIKQERERLPLAAALCFSVFFSRAILDFCPLPPPMETGNEPKHKTLTLLTEDLGAESGFKRE